MKYKKYLYAIRKLKIKPWLKYWLLNIEEKAKGVWSEILTGTNFTLENSLDRLFNKFDLKGNTSQGENPSPSNPQNIHTVNGSNNIKIQNKNLLNLVDTSGTTQEISYTIANQKITLNGTGTSGKYPWIIFTKNATTAQNGTPSASTIVNQANGTYYSIGEVKKSFKIISGTTTINLNNSINIYDDNGNSVSTPTSNTKIIAIALYLGNGQTFTNCVLGLQLEYGSTATDYVSHAEQNLPIDLGDIELCKIGTAQDYIYKDSGKWYIHKEIGSKIMSNNDTLGNGLGRANSYRCTCLFSDKLPNGSNTIQFYCNRGNGAPDAYWSTDIVGICELKNAQSAYMLFSLPINEVNSIETAKTWFTNNETIIYYLLATPTNTEITETSLINQLEGVLQAKSYNEQTNIIQTNADIPFIIDVQYLMKEGE